MIRKPGELSNQADAFGIPSATWAVFESVGVMPDAIQNVWQQIYSEWFSSMGYEHAGGPELEVYPIGDALLESRFSTLLVTWSASLLLESRFSTLLITWSALSLL